MYTAFPVNIWSALIAEPVPLVAVEGDIVSIHFTCKGETGEVIGKG